MIKWIRSFLGRKNKHVYPFNRCSQDVPKPFLAVFG